MVTRRYKHYFLGLFLTVGISVPAMSGSNLYRYKDQNDRIVIGLNVPPEFVSKGYEVLNHQGRIIEKIAPALTPEQINERNRLNKLKHQQVLAASEQKRRDEELMRLYSHPDDAARILTRKIQDIRDLIALKKANIFSHKNQRDVLEKNAADLERTGKKIPDTLLADIENENSQIKLLESEIDIQKNEIDKTFELFEAKITRLEYLTGRNARNYKHLNSKTSTNNPTDKQSN